MESPTDMTATTNLYDVLEQRGLVSQCTDEGIRDRLSKPVSAYSGFDPTADSLHVGSLVPIMGMAHLQRCGHKPVILVGGATGLVGDPSGKSENRKMLTPDDIRHNADCIAKQIGSIVKFGDGDTDAVLVNNIDWFGSMGWLEMLREVGSRMSVNRMMSMESVKGRMTGDGEGISYLEFSYMLMQGYDFVHLFKEHNCTLQLGGQDQWGNIVIGIDLIRKDQAVHEAAGEEAIRSALSSITDAVQREIIKRYFLKDESKTQIASDLGVQRSRVDEYVSDFKREFNPHFDTAFDRTKSLAAGLTFPLVTKSDGGKFGKSEQGNIWLDPARTSVFEFYQFWRNVADSDVGRYLGFFTFLPMDEVRQLAEAQGQAINDSKVRLAYEITKLVHGEQEADKARDSAGKAFSASADVTGDAIPHADLPASELADGIGLLALMVRAGLAKSNGEARRLIQGGGVRIHDQKVADPARGVTAADVQDDYLLLRVGKKRMFRYDVKSH